MTRARHEQVSLEAIPYYHCICRYVRQAFLCGEDTHTGRNFDHRKQWMVDRIKQLANIFSMDICAYAVMSNHYHLVVRIDQETALLWDNDEVIDRWYQLFNGHVLVDRYLTVRLKPRRNWPRFKNLSIFGGNGCMTWAGLCAA